MEEIQVKKTKKTAADIKKEVWLGIHDVINSNPKLPINTIIARFTLRTGFKRQTIQEIVEAMVEAGEIDINEKGVAKKL